MSWLRRLFRRTKREDDTRSSLTPPARASAPCPVQIDARGVKCPDGRIIAFDEIREVSAPRFILEVDRTLEPGELRHETVPGGAVVIKHFPGGIPGPPAVEMIPVGSIEEAAEVAETIKKAWRRHREGGDEARAARVTVAECEKCRRPLRVKASAVHSTMRLTCKCGHVTTVDVPPSQLGQS